MLKPDEVIQHILSKEYVLEHGVYEQDLSDEYYIDDNNVYQYGQMFDKPLDEDGKPFCGIGYDLRGDVYAGYTEYTNGWQDGFEVGYYDSGKLKDISYLKENEEYYGYSWHENGILKSAWENHRKDVLRYERHKEYDETGRLIKQTMKCELQCIYEFDAPDPKYEVEWYENGEFKKIINHSPYRSVLYAGILLDENGYPVKYVLNQNYASETESPEHYAKVWNIGCFTDEAYRFEGDFLIHLYSTGWLPYSGKLCHRHKDGWIVKVTEYDWGRVKGQQQKYYENGQLQEEYHIENGEEYGNHLWWYENGILKKAVIRCSRRWGSKVMQVVHFDEAGNVISESEKDEDGNQ